MTSRTAAFAVAIMLIVPALAAADSQVQLLPTTVSEDPPLLTTDAEHNKLILTAGTQTAEKQNVERPKVVAVSEGTSSRSMRKSAEEDLGLHRLPWQNQQLVQGVIDEVSIFRRMPSFRCEVEPKVHEYFVHHPEIAVAIWRAMGISQLKMWPTGDWSYGMDTRDGTTGTINVLYRSRESCLILCNGMFKSPYLQSPIAAKSVMHLRTSFSKDQQGRTFATHHADLFVSFPSQKVETVAKLLSPVSNVIIDRNFQEISLFIHVMWLAMGRQPGWVEQMANNMEASEERREELIKLTAEVYVATQKAMKARNGEVFTLDTIQPQEQKSEMRPVSATQTANEPEEVIR